MKTYVEYRVRPVKRYVITKYTRQENGSEENSSSEMMGEFSNLGKANVTANMLASCEPDQHAGLENFTIKKGAVHLLPDNFADNLEVSVTTLDSDHMAYTFPKWPQRQIHITIE